MPNRTTPYGSRYSGIFRDMVNGTTKIYDDGNLAATLSGTGMTLAAGLTQSTGNLTVTTGDVRITAGNLRLGAVETFGTTEPTSAIVMKAGTAPAGAITTSGGIFTDGTTVKKIIAAGTVSDVQT